MNSHKKDKEYRNKVFLQRSSCKANNKEQEEENKTWLREIEQTNNNKIILWKNTKPLQIKITNADTTDKMAKIKQNK